MVCVCVCVLVVLGAVAVGGQSPALNAQGQTYFVSPSGSDSNTGTSRSQPWKTLSHASSVVYQQGTHLHLSQAELGWIEHFVM